MRRLLLLALLSTAGACVSTNATILNPFPVKRAVVQPDQVRIYRTAAQVVGKYEEVALLNSTGESNWTNEQAMMESWLYWPRRLESPYWRTRLSLRACSSLFPCSSDALHRGLYLPRA